MDIHYSVGIPVRNEEKSLPYTLDSILNQTILPEEILVCLNGCTDRTQEIVENYSRGNNLIKKLDSNPGKPCAWNKIALETRNNYNLFCDGDVVLNKEAGERLLETLDKNKNLLIVGGSIIYLDSNKTFFKRYFLENTGKKVTPKEIWGAIYMIRLKEMKQKARENSIEIMPEEIINEDAFLTAIARDQRKIISEAYVTAQQIDSFNDWIKRSKRIISGNVQLEKIFKENNLERNRQHTKRMIHYYERLKKIDGLANKLGISTLFLMRKFLEWYYPTFGKLDNRTNWEEIPSTKIGFEEMIKKY